MPNLNISGGIAQRHNIPSIIDSVIKPIYTSDPSYEKLAIPIIRIDDRDRTQTLYSFNPFAGTTAGGVTYCNVSLGINNQGTFDIEIEDTDLTIDTTQVKAGARVYIQIGKQNGMMTQVLSGMIRNAGFTRGCENNLLYSISGFSTGIRLNERILDVHTTPTNLLSNGVTIDPSDPDFSADNIVDDALDDESDYYPKDTYKSIVEGTGGYGYIDSSTTTQDSDIEDFIPGMEQRYQEIQDVYNQVEEYTGGRTWVDQFDKIQFQPMMTPLTSNSGFIITATIDRDNDLASNTMYIDADQGYTWVDSIDKGGGYNSSLYGVLPPDPVPDADTGANSNFYSNKTVEVASRIRLPTNPNWRIYAAVEAIGMDNVAAENTVRTRWRLCEDDNGVPKNTNGILGNRYMYANQKYNTADGGRQMIEIMGRGNTDIDVNKNYWLIFSSLNSTPTVYWNWYYFNNGIGTTATAAPGTSSDTNGGTGWAITQGPQMSLVTGRFKSEPFVIRDQKAIDERILIESNISNFPQQITSKLAAVKYMIGLMYYGARPRRTFSFPSVTMPNNPVFPGDIAYIVDPRFNFSTSGNPVVTGQISDINYQFGGKGAGLSPSSRGQSDLSLSVVSHSQFY